MVDASITLRTKDLCILPDGVHQFVQQASGIDLYENEFNIIPTELLSLSRLQMINFGNDFHITPRELLINQI